MERVNVMELATVQTDGVGITVPVVQISESVKILKVINPQILKKMTIQIRFKTLRRCRCRVLG